MIKELREKLGRLAKTIRELADRADKWTDEDRSNWVAMNKDYDETKTKIDELQAVEDVRSRAANIERDLAAPVGDGQIGRNNPGAADQRRERPSEETRALALQGWMRSQLSLPLRSEHRNALRSVGANSHARDFRIRMMRSDEYRTFREKRGMTVGASTAGGSTVPAGFTANFETALLEFGGPRSVADVMRTDTGNPLAWPTANDTGNKGVLLTEETTIGSTVNPTTGSKSFGAYKISSTPILISAELLEDSAFNLADWIGQALGERIGRCECDYYTTGTGASQPQGCVTAATLGVTTASGTAITADEILTLIHSVDPAYRTGASFMMNDSTLLAVRKLKDNNGQYLWQAGLQAGVPDRLFTYPLTLNQSMASIALSAKTILFGAFSKFKIRDVSSLRLRRLQERYADTDQEGFVAFHRTDSGLLDAGTHPLKYLQQKAS